MDWMSDDESVQSIDFDTFGQWDVDKAKGPAIHIPDDIKNIIITRYRIEWLNLSDPAQDIYAKNHMVAVAVFAQPVTINDVRYESARISMELGPNLYVAIESVGDDWTPGEHYTPGVYTVSLQTYSGRTNRSVHELTYDLKGEMTIGKLTKKIIDLKMHGFLFLPYTEEGCWKGCGDHLLHCWAVFVRDGDIISANPAEEPDMTLADALTVTYLTPTSSTYEPIGRGWWLYCNPVQDDLAPETAFSDAHLTRG